MKVLSHDKSDVLSSGLIVKKAHKVRWERQQLKLTKNAGG